MKNAQGLQELHYNSNGDCSISFIFPLNTHSFQFEFFYPEKLNQDSVLTENEFTHITDKINEEYMSDTIKLSHKVKVYSQVAIYTCICIIGLLIFTPICMYYSNQLQTSLHKVLLKVHEYFKLHSVRASNYTLDWKITDKTIQSCDFFGPWYFNREIPPANQKTHLTIILHYKKKLL